MVSDVNLTGDNVNSRRVHTRTELCIAAAAESIRVPKTGGAKQ